MHGRMHYKCELMIASWMTDSSLLIKKDTYLENVVECLTIRKISGGDIVEVLQISPPRKHCHSMNDFPHLRY